MSYDDDDDDDVSCHSAIRIRIRIRPNSLKPLFGTSLILMVLGHQISDPVLKIPDTIEHVSNLATID